MQPRLPAAAARRWALPLMVAAALAGLLLVAATEPPNRPVAAPVPEPVAAVGRCLRTLDWLCFRRQTFDRGPAVAKADQRIKMRIRRIYEEFMGWVGFSDIGKVHLISHRTGDDGLLRFEYWVELSDFRAVMVSFVYWTDGAGYVFEQVFVGDRPS